MDPSAKTTFQSSVPDSYLLVVNGKPQGPFSIGDLRKMNIKPGDFLKSAGMDDYKEAHEIPELRELFGFSSRTVMPQYFADFGQRLLASVLDWLIVSAVFILPAFVAVLFIHDSQARITIALSLTVLIPAAYFVYHLLMECSPKQATYGKQMMHLRVCDMEGRRISFKQSAGRTAAKILSALPLFTGYLFCFFSKKQQCLHDSIAGTLVSKERLF